MVRMGITAGQQQRRHLAFCISLLPITEKGVKKMIELIRHIKDSLTDDVISDCFKTCISRVKKSFVKGVAGEVNAILEEFEAAVGAIRGESDLLGENPPAVDGECGEENASAPPKVEPAKTAAKTTKSTSKAKKTKTARKKTVVSSDEDSNSEISVDEETEISFTDEKASSIKKARPPLKEVANRRVR